MKKVLLTAAAMMLGVAMTTVSYAGSGCGGCCGDKDAGSDGAKDTTTSELQAVR
jgi:hypothetical protein